MSDIVPAAGERPPPPNPDELAGCIEDLDQLIRLTDGHVAAQPKVFAATVALRRSCGLLIALAQAHIEHAIAAEAAGPAE